MGKKKKVLLRYKRFGFISKKLEAKFSSFLRANIKGFSNKGPQEHVEVQISDKEAMTPTTPEISENQEETKEKRKSRPARKRKAPPKEQENKKPTSTRKRRSTKTKKV
tara:strand:+ start:79 stop:402 length:324 start_codon:yes stop_codon:yes gene_type:complete